MLSSADFRICPADAQDFAVSAALMKTAAQEHPGKAWSSQGLSPVSALFQSKQEVRDVYGSAAESGVLFRPQLQEERAGQTRDLMQTGNRSLYFLLDAVFRSHS